MKPFFTPDKRKLTIAATLILFAPFPVYAVALAGFWPPIIFLAWFPVLPNPLLWLILLAVFFIYGSIAFLLGCSAIHILNKYGWDKASQWIVTLFIIAGFICSSFFHIYRMWDAGGGYHQYNLPGLVRAVKQT